MHDDKQRHKTYRDVRKKHGHKEQFLKDMSQKQEINKFSEESSNFVKILQNFNVLIAIRSRKSGSFTAVAGEM